MFILYIIFYTLYFYSAISKKNSVAVKKRRIKTFQEERKCSSWSILIFSSTIVLACRPYFSDSNTNNSIIRNCVEVWRAMNICDDCRSQYADICTTAASFFSSLIRIPYLFSFSSVFFFHIFQLFFSLLHSFSSSYLIVRFVYLTAKLIKFFSFPFNYLSHCFTQSSSSNYFITRIVYLTAKLIKYLLY